MIIGNRKHVQRTDQCFKSSVLPKINHKNKVIHAFIEQDVGHWPSFFLPLVDMHKEVDCRNLINNY